MLIITTKTNITGHYLAEHDYSQETLVLLILLLMFTDNYHKKRHFHYRNVFYNQPIKTNSCKEFAYFLWNFTNILNNNPPITALFKGLDVMAQVPLKHLILA